MKNRNRLWWNGKINQIQHACTLGVIHKGCLHQFGNFWDPLPPVQTCPHLLGPLLLPLPLFVQTLALFEISQLVNNSHWMVKKLIILFENKVKNVWMKTIFEMMSIHCVPYILYWIQAEWKFYIQTYSQIIWVNFTNMVAIIFFRSRHSHLANHHPSLCLHLSTFAWPPSSPLLSLLP